jgi:hypothetical protein
METSDSVFLVGGDGLAGQLGRLLLLRSTRWWAGLITCARVVAGYGGGGGGRGGGGRGEAGPAGSSKAADAQHAVHAPLLLMLAGKCCIASTRQLPCFAVEMAYI